MPNLPLQRASNCTQRWNRTVRSAVATIALVFAGRAAAADMAWRYIPIADQTTHIGTVQFTSAFTGVAINEDGVVAFQGTTTAASNAVFTGSGGAVTQVGGPGVVDFGGRGYCGTAAAYYSPTSVMRADGLTPALIAAGGGGFSSVASRPDVNAAGEVCFRAVRADGRKGIWLGDGAAPIALVETVLSGGGLFTDFAAGASINDAGQVAFAGRYSPTVAAIYRCEPDGGLTCIADQTSDGGRFTTAAFDRPSINADGFVAFTAPLNPAVDSGGIGVFVGDGASWRRAADTNTVDGGKYSFFDSQPKINAGGDVLFYAGFDASGTAVVLASGAVRQNVIRSGDTLGGFAVVGLSSALRNALNDHGQAALWVNLATRGASVWRADPLNTAPDRRTVALQGGLERAGGASVEFNSVLQAGFTRLFHRASPPAGAPVVPDAVGPYFEFVTDASVGAGVRVTVRYDAAQVPDHVDPRDLRLLRYHAGTQTWQEAVGSGTWNSPELAQVGASAASVSTFVVAPTAGELPAGGFDALPKRIQVDPTMRPQ